MMLTYTSERGESMGDYMIEVVDLATGRKSSFRSEVDTPVYRLCESLKHDGVTVNLWRYTYCNWYPWELEKVW